MFKFPANTAEPTFFRTYSRLTEDFKTKESVEEVFERGLQGLFALGNYTREQEKLIRDNLYELRSLFSGRWLWVGGKPFLDKPKNYYAAYNCIGMSTESLADFGRCFNFLMQGCGVGASITKPELEKLPPIISGITLIDITNQQDIGSRKENVQDYSYFYDNVLYVGDSREAWVEAILYILSLATQEGEYTISIDLKSPRKAGTPIKGFGGVANPTDLRQLFIDTIEMLNSYVGREWDSFLAAWLYARVAKCTVAGNVRRCLPEDALVHTAKGLVAIKDVQVGDLVQTPLGFRKVLNKFDQGMQDVYELETNAGKPRATLNHRVAVFTDASGSIEWKKVSDLSENDRLVHTNKILSGTVTHLPEDETEQRPVNSRTAKSLTIPALTPEVAWLIGFTHGDGYVALGRNKHDKPYGSVSWSMNSLEIELSKALCEKIDRALSMFGLTAKHTIYDGENTLRSVCTSIRLAEYFHQHIKQPSVPLEIPTFILQGSIDVRSAYLAGLFDSDGSLKTRPVQLVCTVYKKFADQVSILLSSLGIVSRVKLSPSANSLWQVRNLVTLPAFKKTFNNLIAPHSAKGFIKEVTGNESFTFTGQMMRNSYTYNQIKSMGFSTDKAANCTYERLVTHEEVDLDIPVTFKALGSYNSIQTYDIEVEEAHCFYCDGYLTHNSAELMQGSEDDPVFTTMKDGMWQQNAKGKWSINPQKDPLRMANHSRMFFHKPSEQEIQDAVRKQYYSGEGAIAYAPIAVIRCNIDLLNTPEKRDFFHNLFLLEDIEGCKAYLQELSDVVLEERELEHRVGRWRANPCFRGDMRLLTAEGYKTFEELCDKEPLIINAKGQYVRSKVWCSGEKEVVELKLSNRKSIFCTEDHKFLVNDEEVLAKDLKGKRLTPFLQKPIYQNLHILLGFMQGDGTLTKDQSKLGETVNIGEKDYDVQSLFDAEGFSYQVHSKGRILYVNNFASFIDAYGFKRVPSPYRTLPTGYFSSTKKEKAAFLHGLYSANGSVLTTGNRVTFKTTSLDLANELLETLFNDFGIEAYITINQAKATDFGNGTYYCRESYDVNIAKYADKVVFFNEINFVQEYKVENLATLLHENAPIVTSIKPAGIEKVYDFTEPVLHWGVVEGFIAHNCVEILGNSFQCNLAEVHLNQLDPFDFKQQKEAFEAAALITASLLVHEFDDEKFRYSREIDPIVGVSITGLFDFFVKLFGSDWLLWWKAGRPEEWITPNSQHLQKVWFLTSSYPEENLGNIYKRIEQLFMRFWRNTAMATVWEYCDAHSLRRPNRVTTVQPAGTKSLLTGASCGYHPPKASRYIRRITFAKNDPIALACIDYGYTVVPSQSDKDASGQLLDDPFDPRCTEWLVEIPVEVPWAAIADEAQLDPNQFSAVAQFDFFMQVQTYYTQHNTSSTIELREHEIPELAQAIHTAIQTNQPYFSTALLSRFDSFESFPRLPFEPISKEKYEELVAGVLARRKSDDFYALMSQYQEGVEFAIDRGSVACESEVCSITKK